jgi:hypothetical protein
MRDQLYECMSKQLASLVRSSAEVLANAALVYCHNEWDRVVDAGVASVEAKSSSSMTPTEAGSFKTELKPALGRVL